MCRYTTILDTGAGSSYIRKGILCNRLLPLVRPLRSGIAVKDANNKRVNIDGTLNLVVQLSTRIQTVQFYVVDKLSTNVIP